MTFNDDKLRGLEQEDILNIDRMNSPLKEVKIKKVRKIDLY